MTQSADFRSGKGHGDENFPVASRLVSPRHRPIVMAFYDFARTADDIADHPTLPPDEKLRQLDRMEAALTGNGEDPVGLRLRSALAERSLPPRHALDLLTAFRLDVTKTRYESWDDLIGYCTYSAMPVGRFVLDVHGEDKATWPASDVLCAVLQINNHLQDCGKDYRNLDRVYLPQDWLARYGATIDMLGLQASPPQLLQCLHGLAARTGQYLESRPNLAGEIRDLRLACEVAAIASLARGLIGVLQVRDPLQDKVHFGKARMAGTMVAAMVTTLAQRMIRPAPTARRSQESRP
jgi:hydroxysqualene synthase